MLWTLAAAPYAEAGRADSLAYRTAAVLGPTLTVRSPALEPLRRTMEGLDDHDHSSTSCCNNLTEPGV